jgi:hypothetical protein
MPVQNITAPRRGATVVIFEPRQDVTNEAEEILDTFELRPGESREYDFPTATASYRFDYLLARDEDGEEPEITPPQEERESTPDFSEEMSAGEQAVKSHRQSAKSADAPVREKGGTRKERLAASKQASKKAAEKASQKASAKKSSAKKAAAKKGTGKGKRSAAPKLSDKEMEAQQLAQASNPSASKDTAQRSASGKDPATLPRENPKRMEHQMAENERTFKK